MLNKLRSKVDATLTKIRTVRNPQPKFINPYAMSEPVTQQLQIKPEFKDGRFILKPQADDPRKANIPPELPKEEPKKPKEPGLFKFVKDVVVSDMEKIAGESRRKIKRNPIIKKEDVIELKPPAFEPEIIEPEIIEPEIIEPEIIEPETTKQKISKVKLVNPDIEIHAIVDIEEVESEEAKDIKELEILSKDVDRFISKSTIKYDTVKTGETITYVKTALRRAEAYKKAEREQS